MLFRPLPGRFRHKREKEWYASLCWPPGEIARYCSLARRGRAGCTSPVASITTKSRGRRWRVRVNCRSGDEHRTCYSPDAQGDERG